MKDIAEVLLDDIQDMSAEEINELSDTLDDDVKKMNEVFNRCEKELDED